MTTQTTVKQSRTADYSHIEPLPDPPREPDMRQFEGIYAFASILRPYFAHRDDVLISGAGYLIRSAGDTGEFAPNCVFAEGVGDPRRIIWRNGYVISEVGKPPDFVLEVASRSTGRRDYTVKREGYARHGVREYWRFDPTGGEYHDAPLAGDTLVDGEYEPLEIVSESDGRHWGYSEVLGLELWWDDETLRFRDPIREEFLPTPEESWTESESERAARLAAEERADAERVARLAAEERVDAERTARLAAEERADAERTARLAAEERLAEMQAELRRRARE